MQYVWLFLSGLLFGNGVPHFVNGVSGRDFHDPSLGRLLPRIPSPLLNACWGLLNFAAALGLCHAGGAPDLARGAEAGAMALGFVVASVGLAEYFRRRRLRGRR